ncbi:MAG: 5-oxoprolinase subunit B family protein [Mycobacterium sp.]|uniref:5-oxoprolinase subunit B family protein n=1 Tax=Mycobacterium sp. TaxID=1785 RepID=UPI003F96226E
MTVAMGLRVLDYGDHALLLDFDSTAEVLAWADALRAADLLGVVDLVSASRTLLIKVESRRYLLRIRQRIEELHAEPSYAVEPPAVADVVIEVVHDGADLADVAAHPGLDEAGVVAAHTGTPWRAASGLAYLVGGDARLQVLRRDEARTKVPAGSVGFAGEFSGIYPRESPGGWPLIGQTDAVVWDVHRPDPALLTPRKWVQSWEAR